MLKREINVNIDFDEASREWRKNKNIGQLAKETALRKPQLNAAQASLKMAQLDIRKINNHINKAIIKAPFSGVIDKKNIEGDQYITMGSPLGSLISIDKAEIKIAISEDNLKKIQLPSLQSRTTHSVLVYDFENSSEYRVGTLVRTDAVLDVATNFFYGYATINDPFSLKSSKPALRIGSFVKVKIKGKNQSRLFKLPVNILNGGRTVWLVDQDSRLKQKKINIVEYDTDHVFVTGLDDGDEVCLTLLPNFLPGQLIQRNNK